MKSFIVALMFIAAVSCGRPVRKRDVSEIYKAQGWTKGADGYAYDVPQGGLAPAQTYVQPAPAQVYTPAPQYSPEPQYSNDYATDDSYSYDSYTPEVYQSVAVATPQVYSAVEKTVAKAPTYADSSYSYAAPTYSAPTKTYDAPVNEYIPPTNDYLPPTARRLRFRRRFRLAKRQ